MHNVCTLHSLKFAGSKNSIDLKKKTVFLKPKTYGMNDANYSILFFPHEIVLLLAIA